jgi:hypothetical protein
MNKHEHEHEHWRIGMQVDDGGCERLYEQAQAQVETQAEQQMYPQTGRAGRIGQVIAAIVLLAGVMGVAWLYWIAVVSDGR